MLDLYGMYISPYRHIFKFLNLKSHTNITKERPTNKRHLYVISQHDHTEKISSFSPYFFSSIIVILTFGQAHFVGWVVGTISLKIIISL